MTKIPSDNFFNNHFHPRPPPKTHHKSYVSQLFSKIKQKIFKNPEISPLQGRIHELHLDSVHVREDLEKIKKEVELDLQPLVLEVIDPMLRNIQQLTNHSKSTKDFPDWQEQTVQRYTKWIDQAKIWVRLYANAQDKTEVLTAVIDHIVTAANQIIERDLFILAEYSAQAMSPFEEIPEKQTIFKKELYQAIEPHIQKLKKLQEEPPPTFKNLKEVSRWKMEIDEIRQHHFNAALHEIDFFAEKHGKI